MAVFDPRHHVIHMAGGALSAKAPATSADDVRRIAGEALGSEAPAGIVLNFHGGLVSLADALGSAANRLFPLYDSAGAYPVFFAWESGFLEAPFDNLEEIAREPLFQEFVKKAGEWSSRELEPAPLRASRRPSAVKARVDAGDRTRADLEAWFRTGRVRRTLPPRLRAFRGAAGSARAMRRPADRGTLAMRIETSIAADPSFQAALRAAQAGLDPRRRTLLAGRGGVHASTTSLLDKEAAARLFPSTRRTLAAGGWIHAARSVADIVLRVLRRVRTGRDHGKYVTLVEEVLRELYVGRIGRAGWWDRMKGDTAEAFKPGESHGGTVFLQALRDAPAHAAAPRITLIGHSAGAIFIGHFLEAAARWLPDAMFDVVLEAPAATHDFLAKVCEAHGSRIRNLRVFGMGDARERADVLVPVIYPASLLYFVSGLLEDEPDQPLVGMARFQQDAAIFDADHFPNVEACRRIFSRYAKALVWAPRAQPPGCASGARHHQDLDDRDPATMASVASILRNGF